MKNFYKKAFSLIEISVVILIVGLCIVAISEARGLYQEMKLATAQSLTKNSRVGMLPNLVSWYETTSDNIFSSGTTSFKDIERVQENQKINRWKDNNPNSVYKYDATQTTDANQPKIIFDQNTSLPIVRFDGSPRYLVLPDGTVPFGNSEYTVIFVSKVDSYGTFGVLGSGTYATNNKVNAFRYAGDGALVNYWWAADIVSASSLTLKNKFQIFVFDYNKSMRSLYIDGLLKNSISSSNRDSTRINNAIGLTCSTCTGGLEYLIGSIAELIIYDRALEIDERKSIEKYLSKKWAIKVN